MVGVMGEPMKVHVAFSGGGIRAQFGSQIAACQLSQHLRTKKPQEWPIWIREFVGLSGGAWGSVTLGNTGDRSPWTRMSQVLPPRQSQSEEGCPDGFCFDPHLDPCQEVERVRRLQEWGNTRSYFDPLQCRKSGPELADTCYGGWRAGIQEGLFNHLPAEELFSVGSAFGGGTKHRILFSTCDHGRTGASHNGVCSVWDSERPLVECAEFGVNGRKYSWKLQEASLEDVTDQSLPLDLYDALAMSSYAYGEAPGVRGVSGHLAPPLIRVRETGGRTSTFRTCDHGAVCNLPLSFLRTLKSSELEDLDAIFLFDYSDFGMDRQQTLAVVRTCSEFWKAQFGWDVLLLTAQEWGYTFFLKLGSKTTAHRLLVHVITFQVRQPFVPPFVHSFVHGWNE